LEHIIAALGGWITTHIDSMGYWGIILMMAIESASIPLPSEVIMPYGGYLVHRYPEQFSLFWMGMAGALGCLLGSTAAYWVGLYGGRPLVEKYGRYVLIRQQDLDLADRWFARYGDWAIFFSRLLPVVRTFISFPAGVARMNFPRFVLYTFIGSFPWCVMLAYIGKVLGREWQSIRTYFHGADTVIVILIALALVFWLWRHLKPESKTPR